MRLSKIQGALCPAVISAIVAFAGQAQANLISNGDFDVPDLVNPPLGFETFNDAPPGFHWTIDPDGTPNSSATTGFLGVDVIDGFWVCIGGTANPDLSGQCLDIDGDSSISQSFDTVPGQEYLVELNYSHHFQSPSSTGFLTVEGDSVLLSETLVHDLNNNRFNMMWLLFSGTFVADSAETTLTLQGVAAQGGLGFAVDNVSVEAVGGEPRADPAVEKTLAFGPKQLEGTSLVDVPGTEPGQVRVAHDQAQFFAVTIDASRAEGALPGSFVLSDGLARFVALSGDGEAAADDPSGGMSTSGSCNDGACDGIRVQADPASAVCTAEAQAPGDASPELDSELTVGTIVVVKLGSETEPFVAGDFCSVTLFVETVEARRRRDDDDDDDEDDRRAADVFEPDAVLELLSAGDVSVNEWFTLNTGIKVYDQAEGNLLRGPVGGIALEPAP